MGIYKRKINPFTGTFDYVIKGTLVSFEEGVATVGDLPSSGNLEGDARIANDTHHLYVWNGSAWVDEGDIIDIKWATLEDKPTSTVENIDDAVSKRHSQNTDTDLNATFEATFVKKLDTINVLSDITSPGADIEDAVTKKHTQNSDTQLINGAIEVISGDNVFISNDLIVAGTGTFEDLGIGTASPSSVLHIKASIPGTIGSHPAGQLIIQNPTDSVFSNVVITAYESDGDGNPDQQLWYLGSASVSNSDITFLNRRSAKLTLGTSGTSRITILGNGNVGINVTDPDTKLDVDGSIKLSGNITDGVNISSPADIKDAIDKRHTQNTDIALRTNKLIVDASGHTTIIGELKIKVFEQDAEPTLNADDFLAMWKDTSVSGLPQVYLIYRRGVGDQVSVELA